jgi:hypothetical protein
VSGGVQTEAAVLWAGTLGFVSSMCLLVWVMVTVTVTVTVTTTTRHQIRPPLATC